MKRLWPLALVLGMFAGALVPIAPWAAVGALALACVVALASAVLELLDMRDHRRVVASVDERFSVLSVLSARLEKAEARAGAVNLEALAQLQKDVEYLKTKEALGLAGM